MTKKIARRKESSGPLSPYSSRIIPLLSIYHETDILFYFNSTTTTSQFCILSCIFALRKKEKFYHLILK